jgi:tRNA (guanine-N1)-methyltransferase
MRIDIMTLFPDTVSAVLHESIIGRACKKGILDINCVQIRDYTENKQMQVDDYPYGGGWGCILMAQPLKSCLDSVMSTASGLRSRVIYMSPQGRPYNQETAKRLARDYDHLVLVCGHYEGVDERFIEECVDEEISMGDFVLTGGEIAAMAVADSVCRLVPGVLSDEECYTGESHWNGLLEYPQYTRPEVWEGRRVPEQLLTGDHAAVSGWRRMMSIKRTMEKRPDMFEKLEFSDKNDIKLLEKIKKDAGRLKLTQPVACRTAEQADLADIMRIVGDARASLKKLGADQWQGPYPEERDFLPDIESGICHVVLHGGEIAGFFTLSPEPEDSYDGITDGKWHYPGEYCTLHRAAVGAKYRGSGMADRLMEYVDDTAQALGFKAVRTDTHRKNEAMKKLLERHGYRYRGNLVIGCEPGHDPRRQAFEKVRK